jgi:transcriptional regulator with XRE-family HTH domain
VARKERARTAADRRLLREVGAKLKAARTAAGITQLAVAESMDLDATYIFRLESGTVNPQALTIARFARAIGMTFWDVLASDAAPRETRRGRRL